MTTYGSAPLEEGKRSALDPTATIDLLKRILTGLPKLEGARCVGHHELFDARAADEDQDEAVKRHMTAVSLCHRCPVIDVCAAFTASERDVGQVRAGRMPRPAQRVGRPRRAPIRTL